MKTIIECPTDDQLKALTLGQLSNDDSEALFQHVSDCDQCRSELETFEDTADSLVESLREPDGYANFSDEPDCRLAVVKALGALANAGTGTATNQFNQMPKSIGEYEILRPIGSGGMGSVFLAQHTKLGREVALKVLVIHRLSDPRTAERFNAEMRAVGRLSHPNIVTAHDAREVEGMAVLIMEYVSGLDLGQLLQRMEKLEVADACEIARRVAVALVYTNSQGFVHRDIKPSNVMLSDEGEIKLLDLGLARLQYGEQERTELTGTGQAMGTADYVAPEQVVDSKTVDVRADIYSLGCTLFKLLTGRAPFADDEHLTTFAKMTAHVSEPPPSLGELLPSAPSSLVHLVDSMLAKKPSDRPATPQDIVVTLSSHCKNHELKKLISEARLIEPRKHSVASTSTTSRPATQSWWHRSVPTWKAIAAGFFGLVLGIFLSVIVVITNPDGTQTTMQLAEGSKVELRESDSGTSREMGSAIGQSENAAGNSAHDAANDSDVTPLSFGILVNRESTGNQPTVTELQVQEATRLLHASDANFPVRTPFGTWYHVTDEKLGAPIKEMNSGKSFVLVSDQHAIRWPSVKGQVLSLNYGGRSVDLRLDKVLASALGLLTKQNLRNQLAIIVNGQVRSAPFINSEVGSDVSINGVFHDGEIEQLGQWLHGGLVDPLPAASNSPSTSTEDTKIAELKLNMQRIGLAFSSFESAYRKFPGTSNTLEGGRSVSNKKTYPFSWRVAILPCLDQYTLYQQYHFDEPWDSEHNLTLLDKMPAIYRSPFANKDQEPSETNILGFEGKNSAIGTDGGETLSTFTDGTANTLLLVEAECTVPWTKPQDIPHDAGSARFFTDHPFTYLVADGSVVSGEQPSVEVLNQMISRNGGERIEK